MAGPRVPRCVVVGGGMSGLATARAIAAGARARQHAVDMTLIESAFELGGNVRTLRDEGYVIDAGPDSWVAAKPALTELVRSLGMSRELIGTIPENRRVYFVVGDALVPMPEGLILGVPTQWRAMAFSPIVGWDAKLRMALERIVPQKSWEGDDDESVGAFFARRFGDEAKEKIAAPLLSGIFAGDLDQLSVRAAFPQFVGAEKRYGSVLKGMLAVMESRRRAAQPSSGVPASPFLSMERGLGSVIDALASDLDGVDVWTGASVDGIEGTPDSVSGRYALRTSRGVLAADAVVLAVSSARASRMTRQLDATLADELGDLMGSASTATVFFGMRREQVDHPLDATGFLVPRTLGRALLACTWVSSKWPHRAPEGRVLMRGFLGGVGREAVLAESDDALAEIVWREIGRVLPLRGRPELTKVFRFDKASAQPWVGHHARVARMRARLAEHVGLEVVASGYDGVGLPDCVRQAHEASEAILDTLACERSLAGQPKEAS